MFRRIICAAAALGVLFGSASASALDITSKAAYVADVTTGECYYEKNSEEMLAPASMTKVMTVYIIYDKIRCGELAKDTLIVADAEDDAASLDSDATNVRLIEGHAYSVDELIGAIMVPSACAASAMAAKRISGSEAAFAQLMNETAAKLGLNAYYEDSSGLSDADRITASSMARLAIRLINEFPDVLNYTSKPYIIFEGKKYNATNHMLPDDNQAYWGADGLKTGTTTLAGYCFTATAVHDGIRLVSVTMHSSTSRNRFPDSKKLLDCGFDKAYSLYNHLFATDMRVKINGNEIPAFYYGGPDKGLVFIIEDLKDYGFDITWNGDTRTVSARYDKEREVSPIPMKMYRGYENGAQLFDIFRSSDIKAEVSCGDNSYTFNHVYPLNGYTAVPADEMINAAKSCEWNGTERCLEISLD